MLTWHFNVSSNPVSLYQTYFVTKKMFLFYKIKNNQLLFNPQHSEFEHWFLIAGAFWLLILFPEMFYVVIYILWTFCYINYMNVTDIIDSFIELETFLRHYHDFLPLRDWAENWKKLSRWIDFSFNSLDESGYFVVVGTCNH